MPVTYCLSVESVSCSIFVAVHFHAIRSEQIEPILRLILIRIITYAMPTVRFHDLRHSYAVVSLKSGDDVKTVQENLGHATAAFTLDVYGHVTEKMKKDSADRMQAFIKSVS